MTEPILDDASPPEPAPNVAREGQSADGEVPVVYSGVPVSRGIGGLPSILLDGARETAHSELTWKLISKVASLSEDDRATLRGERDTARNESERWRQQSERLSNELAGLKARWQSVSSLSNAQSFLYVAGGIALGPVAQELLSGQWNVRTVFVAVVGAAAIAAGYGIGRIGPREMP